MFEPPAASDDEEPDSLLPPRGQSSVSQVLSQMMVGKSELATNLHQPKARKRRFSVDVRHHDKLLYSGPLTEAVTILGTDREADIQLKGRYVAGRHSLLVRVRDSLLLVRLGSSSAARVNGLPKLQAFLKSGDVIQIDETTITVTEE
jgi:pSer/pThr/pTyr-binding forkhead associated (FHA) protein